MRKIPSEQPPLEESVPLKEWLTRIVIMINIAIDDIYDRIQEVDDSIVPTINTAEVRSLEKLEGSDTTTQTTSAQDSPTQILFGPAQINVEADLAANGTVTINTAGYYDYTIFLNAYKSTQPLSSLLLIYYTINGIANNRSLPSEMINITNNNSINLIDTVYLSAGDIFKVWMVSDSAGWDDAGLSTFDPTNITLPKVPSAYLSLRRRDLLVEEIVRG